MKRQVYIGELHYSDGTFDLIGTSPDHSKENYFIEIAVDEEVYYIDAFLTREHARRETQYIAEQKQAISWKVTSYDLTFNDEDIIGDNL